ncbi:MAG: hypothetical protein VST68_01315 [Nitrospirota bacterium]|nr:hypothetical protein [Nitrospirota bacterium]
MISVTTHRIKQVVRPLGIMGMAISLMGFPATCTGPNQSLFNSMDEKELAVHDDSGQGKAGSKPKTWTVYCERKDGAKSKFTVSSELSEQISASLKEDSAQKSSTKGTSKKEKEIALDASSKDSDPFGESTVKCGKLLTLLAIFATVHKQHP